MDARERDAEGGGGPAAGDVPNEREVAERFPHGDDRPLLDQRERFDEHGTDIRQYTGEPVETEEGTVLPEQMVVGSQRVVGGGEFPEAPPRGDEDDGLGDGDDGAGDAEDVDRREVERLDPDAPGRSVFEPDQDAVEPNEPA